MACKSLDFPEGRCWGRTESTLWLLGSATSSSSPASQHPSAHTPPLRQAAFRLPHGTSGAEEHPPPAPALLHEGCSQPLARGAPGSTGGACAALERASGRARRSPARLPLKLSHRTNAGLAGARSKRAFNETQIAPSIGLIYLPNAFAGTYVNLFCFPD